MIAFVLWLILIVVLIMTFGARGAEKEFREFEKNLMIRHLENVNPRKK